MIEAPEAFSLARQIATALTGRIVRDALAGFTPHRFALFSPTPDAFAQRLCGLRIEGARAVGGMVEMDLGPERLILSDGANLTLLPPGAELPPRHQLLVELDDCSCLVVSVRMYGCILLQRSHTPAAELNPYYRTARDKVQVLGEAFTYPYFRSLAAAPGAGAKSLKALLATGQTIPGLGNGVLQEILFEAQLNPRTRAGALDTTALQILYHAVVHTLRRMAEAGGRESESDLYGRNGGYALRLTARTAGGPCPRCGETIRRESYMGGTVYYCPACQPL